MKIYHQTFLTDYYGVYIEEISTESGMEKWWMISDSYGGETPFSYKPGDADIREYIRRNKMALWK